MCGECAGHEYGRAFSLGIYEKALAAAVVALKTEPHLPGRVRETIVEAFRMQPAILADVVVPVPLSKKRLAERGFNQAAVVARAVGHVAECPVDEYTVERLAHTAMHRGLMDRRARETSVAGAFRVSRPRLIEGKSVLLVDDVFTTGSTVSACAMVLKEAGASDVTVFTLARAVKRF
jgi:ComF family protein